MTSTQERRFAEALPRCKTLAQAEAMLGCPRRDSRRNYLLTAQVWGAFDGFYGRPEIAEGIPPEYALEYRHAYATGQRLALAEVVG